MSTELKPCPFCGSNDLHRTSNGHENHSVFCNVCGAEGPSAVSSTEAGEAWNQRALSAQPPAPSVQPPVRERLTETQIDSASPVRIESAHWFKLGARWAERALIGGEG